MWWIIPSLILLGIILMLIEMLLTPGVGVAGVGSVAALVASCWYTFETYGTRMGLIVTCIALVIIVAMLVIILRSGTWKRFELKTEVDSKVNEEVLSVKLGEQGVALTRLAPIGTAKFGQLNCEVKSFDNKMIDAGTAVEAVEITDNKVLVKPLN